MSADVLPTVDGRRARRDQNREKVVDAMLELYREDNLQPSVAAVADRSGVSHRSVFRYFEDLDQLHRVAIERQNRATAEYLRLSKIGQGTIEQRIAGIVQNRLELYDVAAPVARVAHMLAATQPVILDHIRDMSELAVDQVKRHFAPEIKAHAQGEVVAASVAFIVSMESMETLDQIYRLDREQMAAAMTLTVTQLLG
ncbi:MAG: AcrR family transcriptional regulator [Candidatus Aldehydirespiratoraceae bacterium]|jgi:AcrR family transcriptional regulator